MTSSKSNINTSKGLSFQHRHVGGSGFNIQSCEGHRHAVHDGGPSI